MTIEFPRKWVSEQTLAFSDWTIPCTIHPPPKITDIFIQRATRWLESEDKELSETEIYRRAGILAWKDTNNLLMSQSVQIPASEFLKAVFPSDNMHSIEHSSGRVEETGKQDVPLACFVTWLSRDEWAGFYPTPEDINMNPKQYRSWSRHVSRVKTINAMAFDFDGISEDKMVEVIAGFSELTYVAYSSFSHKSERKDGKCSIRIIVPISRPLSPSEYNNTARRAGVWYKIQSSMPDNDEQTKDAARLWYMPSYRTDREEHFFISNNDGKCIDVEAILAEEGDEPRVEQPSQPRANQPLAMGAFPVRTRNNTAGTPPAIPLGGRNADPNDDEPDEGARQRAAALDTGFRSQQVKGGSMVICHDLVSRPFSWIIEYWDTLPKQASGNYNCCRPNSTTVGSAFIHTHYDTVCELTRFRMTSVPSSMHWDCLESVHGISIAIDGRNPTGRTFRPHQNRQNVAKMVKVLADEGVVNIFSCARNNIGYVGEKRISDGFMFDIEEPIIDRWYQGGINPKIVKNGIDGYVHKHRHDALVEKLNGLKRVKDIDIETVFIRYLNVADTPLHRAMTKKWFIGAVARAMHHGCQHDVVLILSGNQGVGKTTFWKVVAGRCEYTGRPYHKEGKVDINNKDSLLNFLQAWIFEWGELSGMNHKSKEDFKLLTSQQENTIRRAYGYFEDDILRKGVIVGSCNPDQNPLVDEENRRIWLMHCTTDSGDFSYSRDDLVKEIDGIWAEAVHLYKEGIEQVDKWGHPVYKDDLWWLSNDERKSHIEINEIMKDDDVHYNMFYRFALQNQGGIFSADEIIDAVYSDVTEDDYGKEHKKAKVTKPPHKKEVSRLLRKIGCKYKSVRVDGYPCKRWILPMVEKDYELKCDMELTKKRTEKVRELKLDENSFKQRGKLPYGGLDWKDN